MKIRTDFITNSSSSSFIISTKKILTREDFQSLVGVSKDHLLNKYFNGFVDFLYDRYQYNVFETKEKFIESLINEYGWSKEELEGNDYYSGLIKRYDEGYVNSLSRIHNDNDNCWESLLYENGLDIKTDDIIMEME